MVTWILLAARDGAKLYEQKQAGKALELIASYLNREGRDCETSARDNRHDRDMESFRHTARSLRIDHHQGERVLQAFLLSIGSALEQASHVGNYDRLLLIAEPRFLRQLRAKLANNVSGAVTETIHKNLLHAREEEILSCMEISAVSNE